MCIADSHDENDVKGEIRATDEIITNFFVSFSGDEVTCGKFYASFLIQDYFKKYRKRKERERKSKRKDKAASLQVTYNVLFTSALLSKHI